ncbi:hypothetical protein Hanom_Chr05g00445221 [Helianthus anomalus]
MVVCDFVRVLGDQDGDSVRSVDVNFGLPISISTVYECSKKNLGKMETLH